MTPDDSPSGEARLYTPRQLRKLSEALRKDALAKEVGRSLCPYCKHLEARWRAADIEGEPGRRSVRVRCSQCQLQGVFKLP
ncbi:MAG: hypothetical protein AB1486_10940 [Planctomycetota bacterium]